MKQLAVLFTLVFLACSAGSESRRGESSPPRSAPQIVTVDAAVDETDIVAVDPAVPDPEVASINANVGEPVGAAFPGYTVRPPPPTIYAIRSLYARAEGIVVAIAITVREGVTKDWKFHLIDKDGRALRDGDLTITLIEETKSWAISKAPYYNIQPGLRAQLDSYSY